MVKQKGYMLNPKLNEAHWNHVILRFTSNSKLRSKLKSINYIAHNLSKKISAFYDEMKNVVAVDQKKVFGIRSDSRQIALQKSDSAFTLVEVLIAGILLAMVMVAVSRFSISALVTSKNQLERSRIEAAINDNIQLLQHADSLLTFDSIPSEEEQQLACNDPANYLKTQITESDGSQYVAAPTLKNESNETLINRSVDTTSEKEIAIIVFSFEGPGSTTIASKDPSVLLHKNEMGSATEQRVLELNPNFQVKCYK